MPELPEVETIARSLRNSSDRAFNASDTMLNRPGVVGRTVRDCSINWERSIAEPGADEFRERVKGQTIKDVARRGKFIQFSLTHRFMICHLRMSGDIRVEPVDCVPIQKHDRIILNFVDESRLVFNDPRKFGRFWLVDDPQKVFGSLGPDPFSEELTPEHFHSMLIERKRMIKTMLLDQTFLAGLGNIYTDEALHLACIHPQERSDNLNLENARRLLNAIREVLLAGVQRNGASIDWVYRGGEFQNYFKVYQRTGKPCSTCGMPIVRIVSGQRGTHYCPVCQQRKKPHYLKDS